MSSIPIFQENTEVVANRSIGPDLYWLDVHAPQIARTALPGQFVHLVVSDLSRDHRPAWMRHTPLLRRPFSVAERNEKEGTVGLIYRVVGGGTEILTERQTGARIDMLGPLGRPFEPITPGCPVVMAAGGVGVAAFFFLAHEAVYRNGANPLDIRVVFGAATAGLLGGEEKFRAMGIPVDLATDDGSRGHHGFVTVLLERLFRETPNRYRFVYVCGPTPMMRRCQTISQEADVPGQVSLEGIMPCGVGVCMACVVPCRPPDHPDVAPRYERVCHAGPVFDIREVAL
ncbi:MAG: dihydroorotate dehydrogenase electron transfer subunit [candidate division Zixibacteria bacterium]|nr:dihydroorotate dehydrogenase electron transfer subunit [candidate division Zixibacteria bacterium]